MIVDTNQEKEVGKSKNSKNSRKNILSSLKTGELLINDHSPLKQSTNYSLLIYYHRLDYFTFIFKFKTQLKYKYHHLARQPHPFQ